MNEAALKTVPSPPKDKTTPSGNSRLRKTMAYFAVIVAFVVGAAAGSLVFERLYRPNTVEDRLLAIVSVADKLDVIQEELESLKHSVSYNVEEEVIFLKILYLHGGSPPIKFKQARKIAAAVRQGALKFKRDPDFVLSIIAAESNFNAKAVSKAGALGLMQVMPQWHDILRLEGDLLDIGTNIRHGLLVYGFYENMYKDTELTLTAYNRGPGMVDTDLMKGKDPNRNGYARDVLKVYRRLKRLSQRE